MSPATYIHPMRRAAREPFNWCLRICFGSLVIGGNFLMTKGTPTRYTTSTTKGQR